MGDAIGSIMGVIKGDTRSLDYGSFTLAQSTVIAWLLLQKHPWLIEQQTQAEVGGPRTSHDVNPRHHSYTFPRRVQGLK